jgi:hypothetical protein
VDAAGFGWFIDPTPRDDEEFASRVAPTELRASEPGEVLGRMDLLSLVMHELGHVIGFDDLNVASHPHELMAESLGLGVRRLPTTSEAVVPADPQVVEATVAPAPPVASAFPLDRETFDAPVPETTPADLRRRPAEAELGEVIPPVAAVASVELLAPAMGAPVFPGYLPVDQTVFTPAALPVESDHGTQDANGRAWSNAEDDGLPALSGVWVGEATTDAKRIADEPDPMDSLWPFWEE